MRNRLIGHSGFAGVSALALATAGLAMPSVAAAQEAGTEEADERGLNVIVVTAQKRTEDMQDVPVSLQVLGGEALEQQGVANFEDYVGKFWLVKPKAADFDRLLSRLRNTD